MNDEQLEEIEARCKAATLGPWVSYVEGRDHESGSNFIMTGPEWARSDDIELSGAAVADQDFIAHARQDIPLLVSEIRRLREVLARK
ncbi:MULTISPECIES: hypothetical protein [Burkholderia]|uniref:hypothetical protein n=1 Tax=Burkholderia TaxID=32008 RepID=UPI0009E579C7|nr:MULTISPECIES: hypothetical protein [Burkholderia]